jgi:hypothetical protein
MHESGMGLGGDQRIDPRSHLGMSVVGRIAA